MNRYWGWQITSDRLALVLATEPAPASWQSLTMVVRFGPSHHRCAHRSIQPRSTLAFDYLSVFFFFILFLPTVVLLNQWTMTFPRNGIVGGEAVGAVVAAAAFTAPINRHHHHHRNRCRYYYQCKQQGIRRRRRTRTTTTTTTTVSSLPDMYAELAQKTLDVPAWPASEGRRKQFTERPDGSLTPVAFEDGHGTIGVFGMLSTNDNAMAILQPCCDAFELFRKDVESALGQCMDSSYTETDSPSRRQLQAIPQPMGSHHITVSMIHEHPSLLKTEEERKRWRPLSTEQIEQLVDGLSSNDFAKPQLTLHSLLWTPDGALIAGFVESDNDSSDSVNDHGGDNDGDSSINTKHAGFASLRSSTIGMSRSIVGELTSLPKNLIHATIGRVLGLDGDPPSSQEQAVLNDLVRRHNNEILPRVVQSVRASGGTFTMETVSMVRNDVFFMFEYTEYGPFQLLGSQGCV